MCLREKEPLRTEATVGWCTFWGEMTENRVPATPGSPHLFTKFSQQSMK